MNFQESNNITVSDIEVKVEKFEESSSVNKSSAQITSNGRLFKDEDFDGLQLIIHEKVDIKNEDVEEDHADSKDSPTEENLSLMECSFDKHESEEDENFHDLRESKLNGKIIIDEHFDELKSIITEETFIKDEVQEEDQFTTNKFNSEEIKDEYFDVSESIVHEDIVIKSEDEDDQSNSKYSDPDYEDSRKNFTCRYCHIGLNMENYKNAHERRCKFGKKKEHLGGSVFECSYCKLLYTREEDKNKHQAVCKRTKESEKYEEDTTKNDERKYNCDECGYESQRKANLVRHMRVVHDKVNALKYSCNLCLYQTIDRSHMRTHLRTHTEFGLICILCQKCFKRKAHLDAHYVSRHPDRSDRWGSTITHKINECPKCLYKTVITSDLKKHLATHERPSDQVRFKCNICEYASVCKSNFTRHLRRHVDQLPFMCTACDKRFNTKMHLDGHIVSRHSNNEDLISSVTSKVHKCGKCDFKTVQSTYLKKHLKICLG